MNADPRLVGAILRSDFYSFIRAIFPIVSPSSPFAPNWHIETIAFALTRVLRGEIKRLIITVPPRSLKSICASVAFPAFVLGHDPTRRIICVSYAEALARKHANDCRALMRSPLYHRLFPNTRISNAKDTELEFATTVGGNRLATSIGGTLTGRGGTSSSSTTRSSHRTPTRKPPAKIPSSGIPTRCSAASMTRPRTPSSW